MKLSKLSTGIVLPKNKQELLARWNSGERFKFHFFYSDELSNFHPSPIVEGKLTFKTAEQYFMYYKAVFFKDYETAAKILSAATPKEAKQIGRTVKNFDEALWRDKSLEVMTKANELKYKGQLLDILDSTEGILVEASPRDKKWGIGLPMDSLEKENPNNWTGENLLGFILTKIRDGFK